MFSLDPKFSSRIQTRLWYRGPNKAQYLETATVHIFAAPEKYMVQESMYLCLIF